MFKEISLNSLEDTKKLALKLSTYIEGHKNFPLSFHLTGDLGTGKTTLVKEVLHFLGIDRFINSPTFTLIEPYETKSKKIFHIDLYRVEDISELNAIGLEEYLRETNSINFIEWPEKGVGFLKDPDILVSLSHIEKNKRSCKISSSLNLYL
ncbi:MAG: tRNA (adenosine(37)-N6)-threonylcarbamoyltransferase complex ATPase subunit type 1 TsaE [Gammaproteobacteria bacterium]|jgi:tRNA threonylcarbamoyladenosine biosynthesis protein TsaE|tara:strand:+ start:2366 stop:2818 length:453 start_codon:yes stop_codon:yes gene_type:complete